MMRTGLILLALFAIAPRVAAANAMAGNASIARELSVENGRLRTVALLNRIDGTRIAVNGPELRLRIDNQVLTSDDFQVTYIAQTNENATVTLRAHELELVVDYIAAKDGPYLRKRVTINNRAARRRRLYWIEVESAAIGESVEYSADPRFPKLTDVGQPVLLQSLWLGLEHPAGYAAVDSGRTTLRHYPGVVLEPGASFTAFTAIIGAAKRGTIRRAFDAYIDSIRPYSGPPRVFVYWNGFRVVKPPNRTAQGLKLVEQIKALQAKHGHVFDAISYDAGFDMYQGEGLWMPSEPAIWTKTSEALRGSGTGLGFWVSFSGIFDRSTHPWGRRQGFGLQSRFIYCLAEPNYRRAARERVLEIAREHDMRFLSFDGMLPGRGYACNVPGHGHFVGEGEEAGRYGTEAVAVAEMEIFRELRKQKPDIVLDLFVCGEWASPWWLSVVDGVHSVEHDTVASPIPSPHLRDALITARDEQVYDLHRRQKRPFPQWADDLYGLQVRRDHMIDNIDAPHEDPTAQWENELVLALAGRGTVTAFPICADLDLLDQTESGLKFLAEVTQWVRANRDLYGRTHYLLGDPSKGEVTGYAHSDGKRTLLALHNPQIETRSVELVLDASTGLEPSTRPFRANILYPRREGLGVQTFGSTLRTTLDGFEVMLIEVRREDVPGVVFPAVAASSQQPSIESRVEGATVISKINVNQSDAALLFSMRGRAPVPAIARNGHVIETKPRTRDRGTSMETWIEIPLAHGTNEVQIRGASGEIASWLRVRSPNETAAEGTFPVLKTRERFWPVQRETRIVTTTPKPIPWTMLALTALLLVLAGLAWQRRRHSGT